MWIDNLEPSLESPNAQQRRAIYFVCPLAGFRMAVPGSTDQGFENQGSPIRDIDLFAPTCDAKMIWSEKRYV
ncbi:MAG: hypothetical protein A2Y54_02670 [Chloroflexi bacterium RBG_16_51_16]|nr:MAG: hypothetical protein A2Y54_02670 [Chloroflexi bacterium RBG_16_51_16]